MVWEWGCCRLAYWMAYIVLYRNVEQLSVNHVDEREKITMIACECSLTWMCMWFITPFATCWQWRKHIAVVFYAHSIVDIFSIYRLLSILIAYGFDSLFTRTMHLIRLFANLLTNDKKKKTTKKKENSNDQPIDELHGGSHSLGTSHQVLQINFVCIFIDDLQMVGYVWHTNFR